MLLGRQHLLAAAVAIALAGRPEDERSLDVLGHGIYARQSLPPECRFHGPEAGPAESTLLWVDWSLKPPGPGAHLLHVQVAWNPALGQKDVQTQDQGIFIARVREDGDYMSLEDVHEIKMTREELDSDGGAFVLSGDLDMVIDADAGDRLALVESCEGAIPVASLWAAPGDESLAWSLAFTFANPKPGTKVHISEALATMPPAWAFSYRAVSSAAMDEEGGEAARTVRTGGVLQLLSKVTDEAKCHNEQAMLNNVRLLSSKCSWVLQYPTYVLHTARMEGVSDADFLAWSDSVRFAAHPHMDLRFLDVSDEFVSVEVGDAKVKLDRFDVMWMDATRPDSPLIRKKKLRRFQVGYRHMCRFQTFSVMQLPAFARTRYMLHLDSDATLLCSDGGLDPFKEMARVQAVYGLFETGVEDPSYSDGWAEFLKEWVLLNEVKPPVPIPVISTDGKTVTKTDLLRDDETLRQVQVSSLALTWGTAWEILDLEFFTRKQVADFSRRVEATLGHYRHLWGDHLIRAYQVQLHAPLESVRCFDAMELPGSHGCSPDGVFTGFGKDGKEGWEYIYNLNDDMACPDLWLDQGLKGVPWPGGPHSGTSPRQCLQLCNEFGTCQGFDVIYREESDDCDCMLRENRALPEVCKVGGVGGDALEAWKSFGFDITGVTKMAAANRYQLIERAVPRHMNCTKWMEELIAKLQEPGAPASLQDLP